MNGFTYILMFFAVLGSALVAGIFFAFSTFIMRALGQLPEYEGIVAMNSINVTVLNPWFFLAFFGTGVLCLAIAFFTWGSTTGFLQTCLLAGCAFYLIGCVLVTVVFNVPMNDQLASVDPNGSGAEALWADYLSRWTFWNHIRTAASLAAAGLFAMAFYSGKCSA